VNRTLIVQGRELRPVDVALIRDWLQTHPDSNRMRLSRALCKAWNWRNGADRLKDMAARSLLLKLEACGQIQLPPWRTASVNGLRNRQVEGSLDIGIAFFTFTFMANRLCRGAASTTARPGPFPRRQQMPDSRLALPARPKTTV